MFVSISSVVDRELMTEIVSIASFAPSGRTIK